MSARAGVETLGKALDNKYLTLAFRVILGSIFIIAGVTKLSNQAQFVALVVTYGLLPEALAQFYATVLPWLEMAIGVWLIMGLLLRLAAGISILVIVSFIVANGIGLYSGLTDECGCFGQAFVLSTSQSVVMDLVMLVMAWQLSFHGVAFLSIDSWLKKLSFLDTCRGPR
jgi:uncharacterized membrane protein YphA (DoxX/SURF4 family)